MKRQTARLAELDALAAELVSLKAQVGRIAELEARAARVAVLQQSLAPQSASGVGVPAAKRAEQPRK